MNDHKEDEDRRSDLANEIERRDLDRYRVILNLSRPKFAVSEACLISDALNGTLVIPEFATTLWSEVEEASEIEGLDTKWGVDDVSLVERLKGLTPAESWAVCEAVERFWRLDSEGQTYEELFLEVGLIETQQDPAR